MPQLIATAVTLLQYGGYLVLLMLACGIIGATVRASIKAYFECKLAYAKQVAAMQADMQPEPLDMAEMFQAKMTTEKQA